MGNEYLSFFLPAPVGGRQPWVGERYYLFYTAHNASPAFPCDEVVRVAEGTSLTSCPGTPPPP